MLHENETDQSRQAMRSTGKRLKFHVYHQRADLLWFDIEWKLGYTTQMAATGERLMDHKPIILSLRLRTDHHITMWHEFSLVN